MQGVKFVTRDKTNFIKTLKKELITISKRIIYKKQAIGNCIQKR